MSVARSSLFSCLIAFTVLPLTHPSYGEDKLSPAVSKALEQSPSSLLPLSLKWTRTREYSGTPEKVLAFIKYPPPKAGELQPYEVQLRCDHDRYYCHVWRSTVNIKRLNLDGTMVLDESTPMKITEDEGSFDGEVCYLGNAVELQRRTGGIPMLKKAQLAKAIADSPEHHYFVPDFLSWAGYEVPRSPAEIQLGLRSQVLVDLAAGKLLKQQAQDNSYSIDIEVGDRIVYYRLAPEYGFAVQRRTERTVAGAVVTDANCSDFVRLGTREVWLPQKITVDWHTWSTIPDVTTEERILSEKFQLKNWDISPIEQAAFVLDYSIPGAAISDAVVKGAERFENGYVDYRVPANPLELDKAIAIAMRDDIPSKRSSIVLVANILAVVILAIAVGFTWLRRRRAS